MKITLLLCLIVVLAGCSAFQSTAPKGQTGAAVATPETKTTGMDSPIIVSDGSTHLKHKGSNDDFRIDPSGSFDVATVKDSGYSVTWGECWKGVTTCPFPPS